MTELVFDSIRVGFPTARIHVFLNGLEPVQRDRIISRCIECNADSVEVRTDHHHWIEKLIEDQVDPFYIVDTDMVFYKSVEDWEFSGVGIAGYRIPEFHDEFSGCITRSRLHTSLLYIDSAILKKEVENFKSLARDTPFTPKINLVYPVVLPLNGKSYFYDTCSLLYHAIGGATFKPYHKDAYFHMHFGTFSDMVLPNMHDGDKMAALREEILMMPELGKGMWRTQDEYFASRQVSEDGDDVIAPISQHDADEARKWNQDLCLGNKDAMAFCDLWYRFAHACDDLIDTMRDGRPRMSKEQIMSMFFNVAIFYNSPFYIAHREILFPIILQVTNTYRDSIAWEHSPKTHLRIMGDTLRTCGNEVFVMVALICGGEDHMRKMSMAIKDRDWLGQHDSAGNPT